ncbi:hypothetical protein [Arthrobacter crystallopoietes]|uniref:Uncharacterized protein n=1 Tax=Crystallibacter crystallopoietes TaxID=37928 RepID=A0A1H1DEX5_9MICC|nr:hypothetical protein [Arthrobacter crystallopoietes]AUI50336.1 hypothetical protein AC20117_05365 [Arthrobacter crystallopoietes]SDQ75012.1 hypothetical protein SAMN04489742_2412 [Arthrobacter crystallopoietes]
MASSLQSTTSGLAVGGTGTDDLRLAARRLYACETALLELNGRLAGLELAAWVSPAGQAFRRSLVERQLRMDNAATEVREAAVAVNAFGVAVEAADLIQPGP